MKKDIHPKVHTDCKVTCGCGNTFTTTSVLPTISVEICSACHPFFTGQQRFVDTERRIDKFQKKVATMAEKKTKDQEVKKAKADRNTKKTETAKAQPTLKEMLEGTKESN